MNPTPDGGNTPRKWENSIKSWKVRMSACVSVNHTAEEREALQK